jgi:type II secretory pathway component PulF
MSMVIASETPRSSAPAPLASDPARTAQLFEMLATLLAAGVPLARALDCLSQQPGLERPLGQALQALESGHSLSRSFSLAGFSDPLLLGLLQLGERTGSMQAVVGELAGLFRWRARLRAELKGRLIYPALLALCCTLLVGLGPPLLLRPILDFLSSSGAPLPWATLVLQGLVKALSSPWVWLFGGLALWGLGQAMGKLWRGSPEQWERALLRGGPAGDCLRLLASIRFGRALLSSLSSGYPLLAALELASACASSELVRQQGRAACSRLLAGDSPEQAFAEVETLDPLLRMAFPLGLATGDLEPIVGGVLRLLDERLQHAIEAVLSLLEPMLLTLMGALVGLCVLATVAPMMTLLEAVM